MFIWLLGERGMVGGGMSCRRSPGGGVRREEAERRRRKEERDGTQRRQENGDVCVEAAAWRKRKLPFLLFLLQKKAGPPERGDIEFSKPHSSPLVVQAVG